MKKESKFQKMVKRLEFDRNHLLVPSDPEKSIKYNSPFYVVGVQLIDIENELFRNNGYTVFPQVYIVQDIDEEPEDKLWDGFKTFSQFKKRKNEISDIYTKAYTAFFPKRIPLKDTIRIIVHYMGYPGNYVWRG